VIKLLAPRRHTPHAHISRPRPTPRRVPALTTRVLPARPQVSSPLRHKRPSAGTMCRPRASGDPYSSDRPRQQRARDAGAAAAVARSRGYGSPLARGRHTTARRTTPGSTAGAGADHAIGDVDVPDLGGVLRPVGLAQRLELVDVGDVGAAQPETPGDCGKDRCARTPSPSRPCRRRAICGFPRRRRRR
jgi:hypothetical protein